MQLLVKRERIPGGPLLVLVERLPDLMEKARTHKYIMRVPTGRAKPRWRYYYQIPGKGLVTSETLKEGARFKGTHEHAGETHEGHWEVRGATESGATVQHTGSGQTQQLSHEALATRVHEQHKGAYTERQGARRGEILAAIKVLRDGGGGDKQADRVRRLIDQAATTGWISDREAGIYRQRVDETEKLHAAVPKLAPGDVSSGRWVHAGATSQDAAALRAKAAGQPGEHGIVKLGRDYHLFRKHEGAAAQVGGKRDDGLGLKGETDELYVADVSGKPMRQKFSYRLVDVGELTPSHEAGGSFLPRRDYPEGLQERRYDRDPHEQEKVRAHARTIIPRLLITDNPDAANGPPIVTPDGIVLGGNSRTMSVDLAYREFPEAGAEYKGYLARRAAAYGFSRSDVEGMKAPILVREVADPGDKAGREDLVRRYNESFTHAMDPRAEQVSRATRVGEKTLRALADSMGISTRGAKLDETFDAYLNSGRSKKLINAMLAEGVLDQRNASRYLATKGKQEGLLNEDGKTLVGRLLMGKYVDNADDLEDMGKEFRDKLVGQIPQIIRAEKANPEYGLARAIKVAGGLLADMRRKGVQAPTDAIMQTELVGGGVRGHVAETAIKDHPVYHDPLAQAVVAAVVGRSSRDLGPGFRKYAEIAEENRGEQGGLFGAAAETRAKDAIRQAFNFETDDPIAEIEGEKREEAADKVKLAQLKAERKLKAELAKRGMHTGAAEQAA